MSVRWPEARTLHAAPNLCIVTHSQDYSFKGQDSLSQGENTLNTHNENNNNHEDTNSLPLSGVDNTSSLPQSAYFNCTDKYASLTAQLKGLSQEQLIQLLLQQIEENQRVREAVHEQQRKNSYLLEESKALKEQLNEKRKSLCDLCVTQTKNLNIIQQLQARVKGWGEGVGEEKWRSRYDELEQCMHAYIASATEAQQQITRNYHLLKKQNSRLLLQFHTRSSRLLQAQKQIALMRQRIDRIIQENAKQINSLKEENIILQKEIEAACKCQFQVTRQNKDLCSENKQLSSQLDFIREKVHESQNLSKDIYDKLQENNGQCQRLLYQNNNLQQRIEEVQKQYFRLLEQNEQLKREVKHREEQEVRQRQRREEEECVKRQRDKETLRRRKEEETILREHHEAEKEIVKAQLIELARQVKFMEDTYKKELMANEQIKNELQQFWEHDAVRKNCRVPLKQMKDSSNTEWSHESIECIKKQMPIRQSGRKKNMEKQNQSF